MCDPLTLGSVALMAGGAVANYVGQSEAADARNGVLQAERIRQKALDKEASDVNAGARDRYEDFGGQQQEKATSLGDYFKQPGIGHNGGPPLVPSVMPASSSNITVSEEAKKNASAQDFSNQQAGALGKVRSFGDLLGGIGRLQARDAGTVGQIGGFKTGSSGIVPYELDEASHAGDGASFLGDILSGVGRVGVGAGLSGGSLGGLFGGAGKPLSLAAPNVAVSAARQAPTSAAAMAFNPFRIY